MRDLKSQYAELMQDLRFDLSASNRNSSNVNVLFLTLSDLSLLSHSLLDCFISPSPYQLSSLSFLVVISSSLTPPFQIPPPPLLTYSSFARLFWRASIPTSLTSTPSSSPRTDREGSLHCIQKIAREFSFILRVSPFIPNLSITTSGSLSLRKSKPARSLPCPLHSFLSASFSFSPPYSPLHSFPILKRRFTFVTTPSSLHSNF